MEDKKIALITGASGGIGSAIAIRLAKAGINVSINYNNNLEGALRTKEECEKFGVRAEVYQGDMSLEKDVLRVFDELLKDFKTLDILINNAGITRDNFLIRMTEKEFKDVIDVNLNSAFWTMKLATKLMAKKCSGNIVNISSVVGLRGNTGQINYSASKAGLIGMTKSLAKEMASRNIRVNAVAPGFIKTNMTDLLKDKVKENILEEIPLNRFGNPEDVANMVNFLVSEESNYITGQVFNIDGGMNI